VGSWPSQIGKQVVPGKPGLDVKLLAAVKSEASKMRAADLTTGGPGARIQVGRRWVYRFLTSSSWREAEPLAEIEG
jgi:hypothetical protein